MRHEPLTEQKTAEFLGSIVIKIINFCKRHGCDIKETELAVGEWLINNAMGDDE